MKPYDRVKVTQTFFTGTNESDVKNPLIRERQFDAGSTGVVLGVSTRSDYKSGIAVTWRPDEPGNRRDLQCCSSLLEVVT